MRILLEGYDELPEVTLMQENGGSCSGSNKKTEDSSYTDKLRTRSEQLGMAAGAVAFYGAIDPTPANEIVAAALGGSAVVAYVTAEAIDRVNKSGVLSGSC